MAIPQFNSDGVLPPGIHAAALREVAARFGTGSKARQRQMRLLRKVVEAAKPYASIKRVLVWGSIVTAKREPGDLDYSIVVSVDHYGVPIAETHWRFFVAIAAKRRYGVDPGYLVICDYPLESYVDRLDFITHRVNAATCGIVEISVRGEFVREP